MLGIFFALWAVDGAHFDYMGNLTVQRRVESGTRRSSPPCPFSSQSDMARFAEIGKKSKGATEERRWSQGMVPSAETTGRSEKYPARVDNLIWSFPEGDGSSCDGPGKESIYTNLVFGQINIFIPITALQSIAILRCLGGGMIGCCLRRLTTIAQCHHEQRNDNTGY